jgi:hypothetical protein
MGMKRVLQRDGFRLKSIRKISLMAFKLNAEVSAEIGGLPPISQVLRTCRNALPSGPFVPSVG